MGNVNGDVYCRFYFPILVFYSFTILSLRISWVSSWIMIMNLFDSKSVCSVVFQQIIVERVRGQCKTNSFTCLNLVLFMFTVFTTWCSWDFCPKSHGLKYKYKRLDLRLLEGIQPLELTHNSSGLSRSWDSLVNPIWRRPQSPISPK